MTNAPSHFDDNWLRIDQSSDPDFFISFLDRTRASSIAAARADPATFFSYLQLRPGDEVLEVGCGTGDFATAIIPLVQQGRIVGLDYSSRMVEEARRRSEKDLPIEFVQGDVQHLEFPDNAFDVVFSRITLQHVPDPELAIREMKRVLRPGGLLAAEEQDWDTLVIDATNRQMTRHVVGAFSDGIRHGQIGRQLRGLFLRAGLDGIAVAPYAVVIPRLDIPWGARNSVLALDSAVQRAVSAGRITEQEGRDWLADQDSRFESGESFSAFTVFRVTGRVAPG